MVKALHEAGIEVILDVVFNHTGEGNDQGPTISFKGLDNSIYYMLDADDRQYYMDFTRLRQHAQLQPPGRREVHLRLPALLGRRDARRRLPLRPGGRSSPAARTAQPMAHPPVIWQIELAEDARPTRS